MGIVNILKKHSIPYKEMDLRQMNSLDMEENEMAFSPLELNDIIYLVDMNDLTPAILEEINDQMDVLNDD